MKNEGATVNDDSACTIKHSNPWLTPRRGHSWLAPMTLKEGQHLSQRGVILIGE